MRKYIRRTQVCCILTALLTLLASSASLGKKISGPDNEKVTTKKIARIYKTTRNVQPVIWTGNKACEAGLRKLQTGPGYYETVLVKIHFCVSP